MVTFINWRNGRQVGIAALMVLVMAVQLGTAHAADDKKSKAQQDRIIKLQQAQQLSLIHI